MAISRLIKLILNDRNYKKYAIKVPVNLNQIYLINNWAKNKTLELVKNFMNRLILFFIFFIAFTNLANSEIINNIKLTEIKEFQMKQ